LIVFGNCLLVVPRLVGSPLLLVRGGVLALNMLGIPRLLRDRVLVFIMRGFVRRLLRRLLLPRIVFGDIFRIFGVMEKFFPFHVLLSGRLL
jgi:hypothetical protein